MKKITKLLLALSLISINSLLFSVHSQVVINCVRNGDWDDSGTWDLGRKPHLGDDVHIERNTVTLTDTSNVTIGYIHLDNNATLYLNYAKALTVTGEIHLDNNSDLEVYCSTSCHDIDMDNRSTICLHAPISFCYLNINNRSNFWGNGNDVTVTNCTNISNPIYTNNRSNFGLDKDCNGNYVGAGKLTIGGNVSISDCSLIYNDITISNGTLNWGSCNVTILGKVTLNNGGDFTTTGTITYGSNAQLVFNRSYTLSRAQKVWATGTGSGVPPVVTVNSGVITTMDTFTVLRRLNLNGGTIGSSSGTAIKFLAKDTLFKCGGQFYSTPYWAPNVLTLYCDVQLGNPPLVLGSEMPSTGFTGDVIVSTNLILGKNIFTTSGKVVVTSTGVLNDSSFLVSQASQVQVQTGGTIITTKSGGLTGPNSLLGNIITTLSPGSTVQYSANTGNQLISQGTDYGNLILKGSSTKNILSGLTTVSGNFTVISGSGAVSVASGSTMIFNGTNQIISGINFQNVTFQSTGIDTLTSSATVASNMNFASGTKLYTNNNLTLLSGASGTAQIGPLLNGADVIGNVCWLRYIPGGSSNRRWNFLSCPIKNVSFRWWQNDIFITGPGTGGTPCSWGTTSTSSMHQNSNGFDKNVSGVYSCFTWDEPSATWKTISSAFDTINPLMAYRTFVRGDRNIEGCVLMTNMPDSVSSVTLHSCGPIVKYTQTASISFTAGTGNGWNYVTNPYPCSIDWWNSTWRSVRSSAINNTIYIWNPLLNQYASWSPTAGATLGASNIIGTGQSFFIKTTSTKNLVFEESYKLDSGQIGLFGKTGSYTNNLKVALKSSSSEDETVVFINSGATLNYEDSYDALKMGYSTGSIASSTKTNTSKLVFNGIGNVNSIDTINLYSYLSTTATSYTLNFIGGSNFESQYIVLLRDKYLNVIKNLSSTNSYSFVTISGVSASSSQTRFEIIIMNSSALPVTLVDFTANKQADKTVLVKWSTASEINNSHFIVEHSTDAINFTQVDVVKGSGNTFTTTNYSFVHKNPVSGMNYYRLTQVDYNNTKAESFVAAVNMSDDITGVISVFPVPANNELNINFGNAQFNGTVTVKIIDMVGRQLMTKQLFVSSKNQVSTIDISKLNTGSYIINVVSDNSTEQNIKFIKD